MRMLLLAVLLLIGCSNTNFNAGMASIKAEDYQGAYNHFSACVNEIHHPDCMYNTGVVAQKLGRLDEAKRWYTLAARYGNKYAISYLNRIGWPVPVADLLQQQQPQQYNDENSAGWDRAFEGISKGNNDKARIN